MIYKGISQTEPIGINTQNGPSEKSIIVLQELGGQYQNAYAATLFGNQVKFNPNDLVVASLRFAAREHRVGGTDTSQSRRVTHFQDVTINEIRKLV